MSIEHIRSALEKHLAAMTPTIPTAFQNAPFSPAADLAHQRVYLLFADPENPGLDQQTKIERGILKVSLYYPGGTGQGAAYARAELLRTHFCAGLKLESGGITVRIKKTPSVAPSMNEDNWSVTPVSIRFESIYRT